jgi:hypothetical protein
MPRVSREVAASPPPAWADTRRSGKLDPPVIGSFEGDVGVFEGEDTFEDRPILVRFIWSGVTTPTPRWEQAFSEDGGETWETNWIMAPEDAPVPLAVRAPRAAGLEPPPALAAR